MTPAIFGLSGPVLTEEERAFFRDAEPAGYILFGRNCQSRTQLRALTDSLRDLHGRDRLLVSIDQEGGRVARLRPPEWAGFPAGAVFDALYRQAPATAIAAAQANAEALGLELASMGINVDYHPPLDLPQAGTHDVIGDRALGREPMQVAALGRAILHGLASAGVVGCIKHMPGHGRTLVDTHKELPTVSASAEELAHDIEPFRTLRHTPIGMTGHLVFTTWDAERPATVSPTVIAEIIRGEIGFDGLLLTDDIDMEALAGTVPERSEAALAAGCDLVLNCWAKMDDMVAIAERCPPLRADSRERLQRALAGTFAAPPAGAERPPEFAEALSRREALLAQLDPAEVETARA